MGWQLVRASGVHGNARVEAVENATARRGAQRRHGRGHSGLPGGQRRRPRGDARARRIGHSARSPSPPGSRPTAATSTPTSTASIRPIRGSCRARASCTQVTFEEMLELAGVGAKVLQVRSVGLAMREKLPLRVLTRVRGCAGHRDRRRAFGRRHGTQRDRRDRRRPERGAGHPDRHRRPPGHGCGGHRPARRSRHRRST